MRVYLVLFCCLLAGHVRAEDVNILDCGAVPDGRTLSTQAIQKAIDRCASTGGGTVTVPPGRFLTNTVFLKSNVNLHTGQGAVLLGGTDPKAFTQALVYANGIENASVTGRGTIDGQGFKKHYPTNGPRHNDIRLFQSKKITVQDVTLVNSPSWVFRILECDGVIVRLIQSTNVVLSGYQSVTPVAKFLQVEGKASSGIKLTGNDLTHVRSIVTLGQECEDSAVREWNNLK